jgi:hypothetical protein
VGLNLSAAYLGPEHIPALFGSYEVFVVLRELGSLIVAVGWAIWIFTRARSGCEKIVSYVGLIPAAYWLVRALNYSISFNWKFV